MKEIYVLILIILGVNLMSTNMVSANECLYNNNNGMIVRISEIEVYPEYLDEYLNFAVEVAETSVEKEKGVVVIYPMMLIRDNNQIRILEIYKNEKAYKKHAASEHFQKYKKGTLHMVKSLELVDTYQLSPTNFKRIFKKNEKHCQLY